MRVDQRFATYGTLAPGKPNHHQLADLSGKWCIGTVRGRLVPKGWGADLGFPALILSPDGDEIVVHLFESIDLPQHWQRLDQFEGTAYCRVIADVAVPSGTVQAWIYVASEPVL